jgi:hypothetical protein
MMKLLSASFVMAATFAMGIASSALAEEATSSPTMTVAPKPGRMLYTPTGRLGTVTRVSSEGNAQVIVDGRMVNIPISTLSEIDGKLTTSLTKRELLRAK